MLPCRWIDVDVLDRGLIGCARLLAGAQHVLVGRELHRLGDAGNGRLAADIGRDVEDAGLGRRRVGHGKP